MAEEWIVNSDLSKKLYLEHLDKMYKEHGHLITKMKTGKQVSGKQFRAMHVFIRDVVAELRDRGITTTEFFDEGFDLPWTEQIFKNECWKPLQKAIMEDNKTKSTKDQTKDIPGKVHEVLSRKFASWGFHVPWPEKKDK
jgi:hypothetical protein